MTTAPWVQALSEKETCVSMAPTFHEPCQPSRSMTFSSMRRIAGNAISILTSDVLNRATTFILYALVARHLSAFAFGQMSLALTLFYTFQMVAVAGTKTLITREVARDKRQTGRYLVNGSIVVAAFSLLAILLLLVFVRLMHYAPSTAGIILLLSIGLLPAALSAVYEGVFQAWERMHYIAYANVPVNLAKVGVALLLLSQGHGIYHLIILLMASQVAVAGIERWLLYRYMAVPRTRVDLQFALVITRATAPFLGIDVLCEVRGAVNVVLLSKLAGETAVGLYSAANQLMIPVILVCQNIILSIFPIMCRRFDVGLEKVGRVAEYMIELLLAISLPTAVGLFILADPALVLLYGKEDFLLASGALRILVWNLLLVTLTHVLGQVLLASLREKITLRIVAIDVLVNLAVGPILISQFGLLGAAVTALLTRVIDFLQHYVSVSRLLSDIALAKLARKPVVASVCMAIFTVALGSQGVLRTAVIGGAVYAGVLLALALWSAGSVRQLKARYLL
jgi:O-antigen/teichoic acid export membrane protein